MESKRQKKYARLIQKELGEIFQRTAKDIFEGAFITVTYVKISPDLGVVKAYLSFLLTKDKQVTLNLVEEHQKHIRQILATRIKNQVRIIPELHFYLDDTDEVAAKVDEIFRNIEIPPADKDYKDEDYRE